jgi:hypothetical protein
MLSRSHGKKKKKGGAREEEWWLFWRYLGGKGVMGREGTNETKRGGEGEFFS